jgi:hypothetical protein
MYYLYDFLKRVDVRFPKADDRLTEIAKLQKNAGPGMTSDQKFVLNAEALDLAIIISGSLTDEKARNVAQAKAYASLDKLLSQSKSNYFLRKAMNVRAIGLFAEFNQLKYMDFIASDWIRDTLRSDTEFIYARELVATTSLSEGYAYWAKGTFVMANGYFYNALNLTDDLEAHAGFIKLQYLQKKQDGLDRQYTFLKTKKMTDENYK